LVTALHPMCAEDTIRWKNETVWNVFLCAEDATDRWKNETAWNVIRERLFSGENSKAYRFEDDIRLQVTGAKTHQDSAVFVQLVGELNKLLETVQVKLVKSHSNYSVILINDQSGLSTGKMDTTKSHQSAFKGVLPIGTSIACKGYKIDLAMLTLKFQGDLTDYESVKGINYYTIRLLTRLFTPHESITLYGGIFDASKPADAEFTDIDKKILKQLYSRDFYKNLRNNTVKENGYPYYLDLRYGKLLNSLSYAFKALLLLFGFLFLLSRESKRKPNPSLNQFIRQWVLIPLLFPFFYSSIITTGMFSFSLAVMLSTFFVNYLMLFVCGLLVLVVLYYVEPIYLKRISNFFSKQAFVFLSTTVSAILVQKLLDISINLIIHSFIKGFDLVPFWSQDSTLIFLIVFVAALRVFFNVIQYRIQSMVNQKDVEIAKMKELKNQAELNALHSRINPHFLYNALNSIASLAHIDAGKTENMALGLSELFRYSINKENKTYVTVGEELEMVNKYLDIEKTRFGDRLVYEIKVDEDTREQQIPKFLIQPLVENAVKHGLSKIKDAGRIVVEVKKNKKDLIIAIYDNGPDFPAEPVSGYGLQNLNDKLSIIYGSNASFNWVNGADKHVTITLKHIVES
jgi:sensor histidine kinase YesM